MKLISNVELYTARSDVVLIVTVLALHNFYYFRTKDYNMNNEMWKLFASVVGFTLNAFVGSKIGLAISDQLNIKNNAINQCIYDAIKFGIVFLSQQVTTSYMLNGTFGLNDNAWLYKSVFTIVGYWIFNLIQIFLPDVDPEYKPLFEDVIKVSIGALFSQYVITNTITVDSIVGLVVTLLGFTLYHTLSKKVVVDKDVRTIFGGESILPWNYYKKIKNLIENRMD